MRADVTNPSRAVIYCRVAREDDEMIEKQEKILRAYANKQGYGIRDVYRDNGFSGIELDRPAMGRLDADIAMGFVGVVMVTDLSRINRDMNRMLDWINNVRKRGVRVISVRDGITDDIIMNMDVLLKQFCRHFK